MANVTIKDIAQVVGVSHPTVSKALNNSPGVNERTRERILEVAKQMNYVPNAAAKRLANQKNRSIGFIWPQVEGLFFYHLCGELQKQARNRAIDVLVSMSEPVGALRTFHEHFIDFTLAWFFPTWIPSSAFIMERERYPGEMMIIGGGRMENAHTIGINRIAGIQQAVEHLAQLGHKKIAYLGEEGEKSEGFIRGLLECALPHSKARLMTAKRSYDENDQSSEVLQQKFSALWQTDDRPTGLIIDSQNTAFWLLRYLQEYGISVPGELSLISYDDIPELSVYPAALTTCGPSIREIVQQVLDSYENFYVGNTPSPSEIQLIEPKLIIRESTQNSTRVIQNIKENEHEKNHRGSCHTSASH